LRKKKMRRSLYGCEEEKKLFKEASTQKKGKKRKEERGKKINLSAAFFSGR